MDRRSVAGRTMAYFLLFVVTALPAGGADGQGAESLGPAGGQLSPAAVSSSVPFTSPPFMISERPSYKSQPAITYNHIDREFLVVWANYWDNVGWDVYAQRISRDGKLLSWFYVGDGLYPDVAYNPVNNSYLVVYERNKIIYARRVTYQGPLGAEFPVAASGYRNEYPQVSYNKHPNYQDFMVVWEFDYQLSIPPIYGIQAQRVAGLPQGGPGGSELIGATLDVSNSPQYSGMPDIAYNLNRNEYLVVYEKGTTPNYDVFGRRITGGGVLLPENPIDTSANQQRYPKVAAYSPDHTNPYLVVFFDAWNDPSGDVRGYLVNGDGNPVLLVNIATAPGIREEYVDIASSEEMGGYTTAWLKTDGDTHIWMRRIDHAGGLGPVQQVNEPANPVNLPEQALAMGSPLTLIAWEYTVPQGRDLAGRLAGYRVNLPVVIRR